MNPYDILGVPRDASPADIKAAFRRLAALHHPDKGGDAAKMAEINDAWAILGDAYKRAEFDATGRTGAEDAFEREARDWLVGLFGQAIDTDETDVIGRMRSVLEGAQQKLEMEIAVIPDRQRRLMRQRDRVKRKGEGANLYVSVIDGRLAALEQQVAQMEHGKRVFDRVRELLEDYESAVAVIQARPVQQTNGAFWSSGMFNNFFDFGGGQ